MTLRMRMRDLLFKDFGWKLFSLLLAAFIWYTVQRLIEPKPPLLSAANVAVQYDEIPVRMMPAGADGHASSNSVAVTVSGPPVVMNVLQANQIHALVDLSDINPKAKIISRPVEVSVPWGVTVVEVQPARLEITPPAQP